MELYYKPTTKNQRGGTIVVNDNMSDEAKEAQRSMAKSLGLFLVEETTHPKPTIFAICRPKIVPITNDNGEVTGYRRIWEETPRTVKLSQSRIVSHPKLQNKINDAIVNISKSQTLSTWWASDMSYTHGSDIANELAALFGLSVDALEDILKQCL